MEVPESQPDFVMPGNAFSIFYVLSYVILKQYVNTHTNMHTHCIIQVQKVLKKTFFPKICYFKYFPRNILMTSLSKSTKKNLIL